jgi:hypothetical protein
VLVEAVEWAEVAHQAAVERREEAAHRAEAALVEAVVEALEAVVEPSRPRNLGRSPIRQRQRKMRPSQEALEVLEVMEEGEVEQLQRCGQSQPRMLSRTHRPPNTHQFAATRPYRSINKCFDR